MPLLLGENHNTCRHRLRLGESKDISPSTVPPPRISVIIIGLLRLVDRYRRVIHRHVVLHTTIHSIDRFKGFLCRQQHRFIVFQWWSMTSAAPEDEPQSRWMKMRCDNRCEMELCNGPWQGQLIAMKFDYYPNGIVLLATDNWPFMDPETDNRNCDTDNRVLFVSFQDTNCELFGQIRLILSPFFQLSNILLYSLPYHLKYPNINFNFQSEIRNFIIPRHGKPNFRVLFGKLSIERIYSLNGTRIYWPFLL